MWAQQNVAHLGVILAGILCWLDGAVRAMVTHVAGSACVGGPSESLSAREQAAETTPSEGM